MNVDEFNYCLPKKSIAQKPCLQRDQCRLLILHRGGDIEHRIFHQITNYLREGDVVVINTTKVIPARLIGMKEETGGKVEIFLLKKINEVRWECILRPFKKMREGLKIRFPGTDLTAELIQKGKKGTGMVDFAGSRPVEDSILSVGMIPLPPYIKRRNGATSLDKEEYQTVYAREPGAIAAPTAGLHFTPELLRQIEKRGVEVAEVLLHTGWASFFFLREQEIEKNRLPSEYFKIPSSTTKTVNSCKGRKGRVIAVGTTTARALETNSSQGCLLSGEGRTDLFIYPGYEFKLVDALVTNFHMPRSSLLLLTSAFAGKDKLMCAYEEALAKGYRFLSYGDAMLIV